MFLTKFHGGFAVSRAVEGFVAVFVIGAVVLAGCSGGGDEPAEVSKTVEIPADADGGDTGAEGDAAGEVAPIPFDEFDPTAYEVGDVVPEVEIVEPVEYPEMKNFDEAGAEAAAQYMIDVLNYTYNTGDTTFLEGISHDQCQMCAKTQSTVGKLSEENQQLIGPVIEIHKFRSAKEAPRGWSLIMNVDYVFAPVVDVERVIFGY